MLSVFLASTGILNPLGGGIGIIYRNLNRDKNKYIKVDKHISVGVIPVHVREQHFLTHSLWNYLISSI